MGAISDAGAKAKFPIPCRERALTKVPRRSNLCSDSFIPGLVRTLARFRLYVI